jgi:hypothetical protein
MKGDYWLINQHIREVFAFSPEELQYLETRYRARIALLRELFPWDDPNYGVDEHWACFYPYGVTRKGNESAKLEFRLTNHSPSKRTFHVAPRAHGALRTDATEFSLTLQPREVGTFTFVVASDGTSGNHLVTADIRSDGMEFREWAEALITVE